MTDQREMGKQINTLARQFMNSQILFAANKAGVFTHLETPSSAEEVAAQCGWSPRTARMLLGGLIALELVEKVDGRYRNTAAASACLVPGKPQFQGNIVRHIENTALAWRHLDESLKTGQGAPKPGPPSADDLRSFILGMKDIGQMSAREIIDAVDLSEYRHVLDLGGGPGSYALAFLGAHADMRATIFDRADVLAIAREQVAAAGMEDRVSYRPGDMLADSIGAGYDLILVSNIIHSFSEADNRRLVAKCFDALPSGGTLIIKDFLTDDDGTGPAYSLIFALHMLVATGDGDTYSFAQVASWTRDAGFADGRVVDLTPQTRLWIVRKP